ncbi:MAG: Rep catalytic domain protein [Circoviridae sp.]|nr:MAG: Rep catalytic domain protein [Circoviridae sp.]
MTDAKKFRIQYTTVGLTYSRCPLEKSALRDFLLSLPHEVSDYYIVQETHKEANDCLYHLHAWIEFTNKPNIRNCNFFDCQGFHPNIGKKKRNWIWNYLKKQDTEPLTNIEDGYVALAKAGLVDRALDCFSNQHPKDFIINYERIVKNVHTLGKRKRQDHIYPLTGDIIDWDMNQQSLLVIGPTGCGKTEWAKSFVTHHLEKTYLRITHIDGLKKYNGEDFIIYDDLSFKHLPRETNIHLAEVRNARDIHCRHAVAPIPPGICNIFLANEYPFLADHHSAIDRRLFLAPSIRFY